MIVDSREQKYLPFDNIIVQKLDVGDYTTPLLEGRVHVERKSPNDLYGTILQGHARFKREFKRAEERGIELPVFVECPEKKFYAKTWKGGKRLQCSGEVLEKIINTLRERHGLHFLFCKNRKDMMNKMIAYFEVKELEYGEKNT